MAAPAAPATDLPQRPARKPFGSMSLKLDYPQREGFHRHWFNDIPGRMWAVLLRQVMSTSRTGWQASEQDCGHCRGWRGLDGLPDGNPRGMVQPRYGPEQRIIDDKEASMKRGVADGPEGEGQYVPKQGIKIRRG
jgi:hypothetical protein